MKAKARSQSKKIKGEYRRSVSEINARRAAINEVAARRAEAMYEVCVCVCVCVCEG